jgi:hypothetical protein
MADPCAYARCTAQVGASPYVLDVPEEPARRFCSVTCCWSWFQDHLGVKAAAPVPTPVPMPKPVTRAKTPTPKIFPDTPQPVRRRQTPTPNLVWVPVFHGAEVGGAQIGHVELDRRHLPTGMAWHLELQPTHEVYTNPPRYEAQAFHLIVRQVAKSQGAVGEGQAMPALYPSPGGLLGMRCAGCGLGVAVCVCGTR